MARPVANPDSGAVSGVTFRDTAYKSRQIVLDDGQVFHVTGSSITTDDPALIIAAVLGINLGNAVPPIIVTAFW